MDSDRTVAVSNSAYGALARDTVLAALVHGLEAEFGHEVSLGLAQRFLDAEECDFLWAGRCAERWLGQYESAFEETVELDRIAVFGAIGETGRATAGEHADGSGRSAGWYAAVLVVDGEGDAHGVIARSTHATRSEAEAAWIRAARRRAG